MRRGELVFDLKHYGAKGDGVSDDTGTLQAAIDAAALAGGGLIDLLRLRVRIGRVIVSSPDITIANGTIVDGTIQLGVDDVGPPYVTLRTVLQSIRFERSASNVVNAIEAARAYGLRIRDCEFTGYHACFYVRPQSFTGANTVHVARVEISRCASADVNFVLRIPPFASGGGLQVAADISVVDCSDLHVKDSHIYAEGIDGLVVTGCTMFMPGFNTSSSTKRHNIYVDGGSYITIADNQLFESGLDAVYLSRCQNVGVANNRIGFPGQRVHSDGVRVIGGDTGGSEYVCGSIVGNTIFFPDETWGLCRRNFRSYCH